MRYLTLLGLLIAVGLMLYLAAPKPGTSQRGTYNAATGAAQHAAGAAEQHVRDMLKPLGGTTP
jgi:ABC-type sulfate transport system substrate-binding protein